jgi:endonuclease YncB( thermonuclease family)
MVLKTHFSKLIIHLFFSVTAGVAFANQLDGTVVGVVDGDTITILDSTNAQTKIRLIGIDAPEKAQPFGERSKINLSNLVFNKSVTVLWGKRDRYGRTIGKVMVADPLCNRQDCPRTIDANLEQVKAGLAWWYRDYAKEQSQEDQDLYEQAEFRAKIGRVGLWSDKNPMPPWGWRRESR